MNELTFAETLKKIVPLVDGKLVFLLGVTKSGKTMLESMLGTHDDVFAFGEGNFFDEIGANIEKALKSAHAHRRRLCDERGLRMARVAFKRADYFETILVLMGLQLARHPQAETARIITETTPDKALYLPEIASMLPNARFIVTLRDGRDALTAAWGHESRIGSRNGALHPTLEAFADIHFGQRWADQITRYLDFAKAEHHRCLVVRYETFFQEPTSETARLFRFLDLPGDNATTNAALAAGGFSKTPSGWQRIPPNVSTMHGDYTPGSWRNALSADALDQFMSHAGSVMARAGYGS